MKKIILLFFALFAFSFYSCEVEKIEGDELISSEAKGGINKKSGNTINFDFSEECQMSESILYAGKNTEVGKVTVTEDNGDYVITFQMTNPEWCMTETHLSVKNSPESFPMNKGGNPKIGNFEFGDDELDCAQVETYRVAITEGPYIAAHAVVICTSSSKETILSTLPEQVDFCTTDEFRPNNGERYFDISVDGGILSGNYSAWCVDVDKALGNPECIELVNVYSSLGELPEGAFEQTDNFGGVNWLLNQTIIGEASTAGGNFTGDDFQIAIWLLVDDLFDINELADRGNVENWNEDRVLELVEMGKANLDFSPDCGELIGIILDPGSRQKLIIAYPLECNPCNETAWADGCNFPGGSWATYFEYRN